MRKLSFRQFRQEHSIGRFIAFDTEACRANWPFISLAFWEASLSRAFPRHDESHAARNRLTASAVASIHQHIMFAPSLTVLLQTSSPPGIIHKGRRPLPLPIYRTRNVPRHSFVTMGDHLPPKCEHVSHMARRSTLDSIAASLPMSISFDYSDGRTLPFTFSGSGSESSLMSSPLAIEVRLSLRF